MEFARPFYKLPIAFSPETLAAEVRALPGSAWQPHPTGFPGNEAVRLVTPGGKPNDDIDGPMDATPELLRCPYIQEVMAELGGVWGRSRLMGLGAGANVPFHIDINYYWRTHLRIHIPVITNPQVRFTCGEETVHMEAGECWVFDSFRRHTVENAGSEQRIHLVLDTVGGERLWDLVEQAQSGSASVKMLLPGERQNRELQFERVNTPKVMSPWEMRCHLAFLHENLAPHAQRDSVEKSLDRFLTKWTAAWSRFGTADEGLSTYEGLIAEVREKLAAFDLSQIRLANGVLLVRCLEELIFKKAVTPELEGIAPPAAPLAQERVAAR
jgi:hypothetical protein